MKTYRVTRTQEVQQVFYVEALNSNEAVKIIKEGFDESDKTTAANVSYQENNILSTYFGVSEKDEEANSK